jgi:beta-lactamase regulating signal transducer with metallopeptidase domain
MAASPAASAAIDWYAVVWQALIAAWVVGAVALLLRDAAAQVGLMRWRRRASREVSPEWRATIDSLSRAHPVPRNLAILQSHEITAPCTWGVFRPVLLLPESGEGWTENERHHALVHELAHVRRHDYLSALVARLCCAVHWYNPLVWFAAAQVRRLQEQAADDAVLRAGGRASEYAQLLLNIAGDARGPVRIVMGMAARSALKSRVLAILGGANARVEPGVFAVFGVLVALSTLMLFIATASAAPPESERTRTWVARSSAAADKPQLAAAGRADPMDDTGVASLAAPSSPVVLIAHRVTHQANAEYEGEDEAAQAEAEAAQAEAEAAQAEAEAAQAEAEAAQAEAEAHADMASMDDAEDAEDTDEPEEIDEPEDVEEPEDMSMDVPVVAPVPPTPPAPPRVVVRERSVVVRVPAVPAIDVRGQPARNIVVRVPRVDARPHGPVIPARRVVVRVPAVPDVHVPAIPARSIVVRVPDVRVERDVRVVVPRPPHPTAAPMPLLAPTPPAAPMPHIAPVPHAAPTPPTPPTPPESGGEG